MFAPVWYAKQRHEMVRNQLVRRGIADARVLAAMEHVPREIFLPPDARQEAYADRAMAIDCGQTISQPYIVALMTEGSACRVTKKCSKSAPAAVIKRRCWPGLPAKSSASNGIPPWPKWPPND